MHKSTHLLALHMDLQKSVRDARANWYIPKEMAEFEWREPSPSQAGRVTVRHPSRNGRRGDVIFDVAINDGYSAISVPVWSKVPLLPVDFLNLVPLVQLPLDREATDDMHILKTRLSGSGWVKPAAMTERPRVDASILPEVDALYGISITGFELQFKKPLKLVQTAGTVSSAQVRKSQ
jgi:hypothetical protein